MAKIKIITDSTADVPAAEAKRLDIEIIPIKLTLDGENYIKDGIDISNAEFYKSIRETGVIPKTTQILPFEFEEVLRRFEEEYDEIVLFSLSSAASGTYRNAVMAADAVNSDGKVKVHVIDGYSFSYGYGAAVVKAAELAEAGKAADEIISASEYIIKNQKVYFTVETLDYLKKGGRISTMSAVIGGMLDIRPIITVRDGLVAAIDKVKGEKKLYTKIAENVKAAADEFESASVYFLCSDAPETDAKMLAALEAANVAVAAINEVGSVIGCHAGPGVIGIIVVKNQN